MKKRNATVAVIGAGDLIGGEIAKKFAAEGSAVMRPAAVAEACWQLYEQSRDAWTFEYEIRPFGEK